MLQRYCAQASATGAAFLVEHGSAQPRHRSETSSYSAHRKATRWMAKGGASRSSPELLGLAHDPEFVKTVLVPAQADRKGDRPRLGGLFEQVRMVQQSNWCTWAGSSGRPAAAKGKRPRSITWPVRPGVSVESPWTGVHTNRWMAAWTGCYARSLIKLFF